MNSEVLDCLCKDLKTRKLNTIRPETEIELTIEGVSSVVYNTPIISLAILSASHSSKQHSSRKWVISGCMI